jgi:quinohemoprotein ethanol dehydrogenase
MTMKTLPPLSSTVLALSLLGLTAPASGQTTNAAKGTSAHLMAATQQVDATFMRANESKTADWPGYGLDYAETRFSKLTPINESNVKDLGLVWSYNMESTRGVEATPLVVDGIMYVSASWSIVHAIDVRTGKKIWTYDAQVDRASGYKGCCDVVNRGVALYKDRVYVGAFDGRLIALDAATGEVEWQ